MIQKDITESYKKTYKKFGHTPRSLKWKNKEASEKRYLNLISDLDFTNKTILDVGCGFGDIIPFIENKSKNFKYKGIDVLPEFIAAASFAYPKYEFKVSDFTKDKIDKSYGIILASGSLNSNRENNLKFRKDIIKKLFDVAKYALAFNMAGDFPTPKNTEKNNVWYANSIEILEYCFTLSNKIIFKSGYAFKDFTIIIYK